MLTLVDASVSGLNLFFIGLLEIIIFVWIYGFLSFTMLFISRKDTLAWAGVQ